MWEPLQRRKANKALKQQPDILHSRFIQIAAPSP